MNDTPSSHTPIRPGQIKQLLAELPKRGWDEARVERELGKPMAALTQSEARDLLGKLVRSPKVKRRPAEHPAADDDQPPVTGSQQPVGPRKPTITEARDQIAAALGISGTGALVAIERLLADVGVAAGLQALVEVEQQEALGGGRGVGPTRLTPLELWVQLCRTLPPLAPSAPTTPAMIRPGQRQQLAVLLSKRGWSEEEFVQHARKKLDGLTQAEARTWIDRLTKETKGKSKGGQR